MLQDIFIVTFFINNNFYFMIDFFKNSLRELKHVVWPTKLETKKYFIVVISVLVIFWVYLFLASSLFSTILFKLKDIFNTNVLN